jgi:hypothetical protein
MMKYRVVSKESEYELANHVNKWIEDGWRPQGGVSFVYHSSYKGTWSQAMVKD